MTADSPILAPPVGTELTADRPPFDLMRFVRIAGFIAVILALTAAGTTYLILMGLTPIAPTENVVRTAMIANGVLVAFLVFVVGWELTGLFLARRRGRAAARLHIRIVTLFAMVSAIPALIVAVVASITLDRGLDNWFSTRTRAIVDTSQSIARAYVDLHAQIMRTDMLALRSEFERARLLLINDPDRFQSFINSTAQSRGLPGLFLVDDHGELIAQAQSSSSQKFPGPPKDALAEAIEKPGQPILIAPGGTSTIGGVTKLEGYENLFLYATRSVAPEVIGYVALTEETVNEYRSLDASRFGVQLAFAIVYLGVTLVVLLSAIWMGIAFGNWLVSPIRRLIDAAKEVSRGNLSVAVSVKASGGDLGALSETFNTMTSQLRTQRAELLSASEQIDSRRRFTEAVLSGVPAGVIGIDPNGNITIANRTALRLMQKSNQDAIGRPIGQALPQLEPIVTTALREERPQHRDQIQILRGGKEQIINVRLTTEKAEGRAHGYVITLDDITDLVTAQRSSAWADVARRIAHEIKNPLTPIQLSAERLRRKFGKVITEDKAIFDQCTDTIVRQVGDIGRMVDEFSSFARMPKPTFEARNLSEAIREAVFLQEVSNPDIHFTVDLPEEPLMGSFDARLMAQALTNIVKNATEAIAAVPPEEERAGAIRVYGRFEDDHILIDIVDNGIGLPQEGRQRLLEPYMTTREKGTGLGLAIVTKIIEDHGGKVDLLDAPELPGAMVRIMLPATIPDFDSATTVAPENATAK